MMNKMNENKEVGCHCEENFNSTKQSSTLVSNQCFNNIGTTGCNLEDCRVGVSHLLAMTRIGRSLEKIFKKIFRDDSYFLFAEILGSCVASPRMTVSAFTLATLLSFSNITDSLAAELPATGSCGDGCLYEITTDSTTGEQNLRVYNDSNYTGETKTISEAAFAGKGNNPGGKEEVYHTNANFNKITIDGDFNTIGNNAFWHTNANEIIFNGNVESIGYRAFEYNNFTALDLPETLKNISEQAFYGNKLTSLIIPDSVTDIGYAAFNQPSEALYSVIIPDSLNSLGLSMFREVYLDKLTIICKGDVDKCRNTAKKYKDGVNNIDLSGKVVEAREEQCNSGMYYYTGSACVREPDLTKRICDYEYTGYIKVGDYCASPFVTYAKKRYTPAEANQWLKDDNNSVTITFKK